MNISVVGLGKLGLCSAAYFASAGHKVIGVEKNTRFINELQNKRCPVDETGLAELLESCWDNFEVTSDVYSAVMNSDATLIIVPTPSGTDGRFSNEYLKIVLRDIAVAIRDKQTFHIVDVVSTVMPGSSDNVFKPLLEELSGKICGQDFGLVYNPEFIALGSVIRDFSSPDMVLLGASDGYSAQTIKSLYESSCKNKPQIMVMSLLNAEITKLSLNCFVTMKISFANELAEICQRLPGANVDVITEAIGADSRINRKYLTGGLGFGGTCFPRDNIAFQAFAQEIGYEAKLSEATVKVNDAVVERLFDIIKSNVKPKGKVALFGLSYKPQTHIIEKSQSIELAQNLIKAGFSVSVYDPKALELSSQVLGESVEHCASPYDCSCAADAIVLLTRWPEFETLDWGRIEAEAADEPTLVDSWRQLSDRNFTRFNYIALGVGKRTVGQEICL